MSIKNPLSVIILAAGKGTRMYSPLPKVLHPVAGIPMVSRVINAVNLAGAREVRVVVGYGAKLVEQVVEPMGGTCFKQMQQLGTADAVRSAQVESLQGTVLILNGDHPLITSKDIKAIVEEFHQSRSSLAVVTVKLKKPGKFGRIVRNGGQIRAIVEAKDASHETLKINEVNTGIYIVKAELLNSLLPHVGNKNAQGEFYLTDIVSMAIDAGESVITIDINKRVAFGVNSQHELSQANRYCYKQKCLELMNKGVVILDPTNTYIEEGVDVGAASIIYPGVFLRGNTKVGEYCVVESQTVMVNTEISQGTVIHAMSHLEDCVIAEECFIGPYARIRPGTVIEKRAKVGNFVELKKVLFGEDSKASHLTYLGDAVVGKDVNIGCGTITCNYAADKKKYKTEIGDGCFIGSDSQFIAPVKVGKNAVVGSGSTITKDVPDNALAVARAKQFIKPNYVADKNKSENAENSVKTESSPLKRS